MAKTCWIVSLAPFLPQSSSYLLPDFIRVHPFAPFDKWVIHDKDSFNKLWANCNVSSPLCVTDIAAPLYLFFVFSSVSLFFYTIILSFFYSFFLLWGRQRFIAASATAYTNEAHEEIESQV